MRGPHARGLPMWAGYDCSLKECPKGDDPLTANQRNERMVIECTATNGSFVFSYGGYTTKVRASSTFDSGAMMRRCAE